MAKAEVTERTQAAPSSVPSTALQSPPAVNVWRASLRAIYILWLRDVVRFWRDRGRLAGSFAMPVLYLVIFGTGLSSTLGRGMGGARSALGVGAAGFDYVTFMYPGIIGMTVLFTSIFSAMSIVWDREFGFLKEVMVAPINRSSIAIGKVLGGTTLAMIQGLVLLILAPFAGVKLTVWSILEVLPLTFALAFALSALGVAVASRMRSMQGFQAVMNFLLMPMFFLAGALFPLNGLPGWLTVLTRIDPAAYGIDPIRRVVLSGSGLPDRLVNALALTIGGRALAIPLEFGITIAFGLVFLSLAVYNFRRAE